LQRYFSIYPLSHRFYRFTQIQSLVAICILSFAICFFPFTLCPTDFTDLHRYKVWLHFCHLSFAICFFPFTLCPTDFTDLHRYKVWLHFCHLPYAICHLPFALCPLSLCLSIYNNFKISSIIFLSLHNLGTLCCPPSLLLVANHLLKVPTATLFIIGIFSAISLYLFAS
jgi:hypothetical protein